MIKIAVLLIGIYILICFGLNVGNITTRTFLYLNGTPAFSADDPECQGLSKSVRCLDN